MGKSKKKNTKKKKGNSRKSVTQKKNGSSRVLLYVLSIVGLCVVVGVIYLVYPRNASGVPDATGQNTIADTTGSSQDQPQSSETESTREKINAFQIPFDIDTADLKPVDPTGETTGLSPYIPFDKNRILFSDALAAAMEAYKGEDVSYEVWAYIDMGLEEIEKAFLADAYVFEGETITVWEQKYLDFANAMDAWKREKYLTIFGEDAIPFDDWSHADREAMIAETSWDVEYKMQWKADNNQAVNPEEQYGRAKEQWTMDRETALLQNTSKVLDSLKQIGYVFSAVKNEQNLYAASLTGAQLEKLPMDMGVDSYALLFENEKNCSFSGLYLGVTMDYGMLLTELILPEMSDEDVMELTILVRGYVNEDIMAAFKEAHPEEHALAVAVYPEDAQKQKDALALLDDFIAGMIREKVEALLELYELAGDDVILIYGNYCRVRVDKATILRFLEDDNIRSVNVFDEITQALL